MTKTDKKVEQFEKILFKDSRFITEKDRESMLKKCNKSKEERIVITHGTATMPITAKFLGKSDIKKTIVLVGAAVPANKKGSDAALGSNRYNMRGNFFADL